MTTTPVQPANGPTPTGVPNDAESPRESRWSGPNRYPSPTVGKSRCQCPACKAFFTSTGNFDAHRAWANDDGDIWEGKHRPADYDQRVCLDPATVGLVLHESGHWGGEPMTDEQKRERGWA